MEGNEYKARKSNRNKKCTMIIVEKIKVTATVNVYDDAGERNTNIRDTTT
jgi:hypothetical protein